MKKKKNNFESGFTLTELLVGMSIFSLILVAVSGIFVSAIRVQRRALAAREVSGQTSYLAEYISRALRMARKDENGDCISTNTNYETTTDNGIRFLNYQERCQEIFLEGGRIKEKKSTNASSINFGDPVPLTSPNLRVNYFNVNLLGPDQPPDDYQQPRVTIAMEIATASSAPLKIQITVSQRQLDFAY